MNFSIIVNADTHEGHILACELAMRRTNLILIVENLLDVNVLRNQIRKHYKIQVHCFEFNNISSSDLVNLCDFINDHFLVNMLIHIVKKNSIQDIGSCTVKEVENVLTSRHVIPMLMLHQFWPNLLLHVDPVFIQLECEHNKWTSEKVKQVLSDNRYLLDTDRCCYYCHIAPTCEHKCSKMDN